MAAPKLRFKEFSEDWGSKKIIELADYVDYRGKTPKKVESGVLLVTAKNIKQGYLDYSASQEFIEESAFDDVMRRGKVELNDVLITTEAPLGNVASVDRTDIALAQRVIKYRGKIGLLDNLFLKQKFLSESFQEILKSKATGGTVQGIKGSVLHQIPLIVPSKEEQTKIASFLSAVDEKISQLTQKHQLLSQYKQGMMQKLFSQQLRFKADDGSEFGEWEEKLIKDIADVKGGKRIPKGYALVNENTGHPYITVSDMNRSYSIDSTNIRYVPLEVVDTIKRYTITDKDIFISVAGTLGIIGKIPTEFNGANLTENADKLTNLKCHQDFLIYLLDSGYLSELIESTATTSAQPKLALYAIEQLEIQIPCLEEQIKIANLLSTIDQKIAVVAQQIEQAKTWKKGLLQQMFV